MEKKSSLLTLALAAAFTAMPAAAAESREIRVVSSGLMDAIEAWSSPTASFESVALESRPELIEEYVPVAERYHGGRRLVEVYAEQLPRTLSQIRQVFEAPEEIASAELLAYAMAGGGQEYVAWQAELESRGAGFATFVRQRHPEAVSEVERANITPAAEGIGLLDYLSADGDDTVFEEFRQLWATIGPQKDCTCWTVVNFPDQPNGWTSEIAESFSSSWGKVPKKRQNVNYFVDAQGAARDINFWRKAEHNLWEVSREKSTNVSGMRVRMTCTQNTPTAENCTGPTCQGEFVARVGYASRVYESHDVGGPWSREAQALTADRAELTYDGPGTAPLTTLFDKGVAVSGQYQSGWNSGAVADLLFVAGQVTLAIATDGTTAATLLTQDMVDSAVNGVAGLISHSGSTGNLSRDMMVAWDNSLTAPIVLLPNETHLFELEASSKIYGRGYGGRSETWGNIDSADYLVGVGRNYRCAVNVVPPVNRAYWSYGRSSNAPYSAGTMMNFIGTFTQTELGVYPTNLSSAPGQFP